MHFLLTLQMPPLHSPGPELFLMEPEVSGLQSLFESI